MVSGFRFQVSGFRFQPPFVTYNYVTLLKQVFFFGGGCWVGEKSHHS